MFNPSASAIDADLRGHFQVIGIPQAEDRQEHEQHQHPHYNLKVLLTRA
jgi:hypothetical protein